MVFAITQSMIEDENYMLQININLSWYIYFDLATMKTCLRSHEGQIERWNIYKFIPYMESYMSHV